MSLRTFIVLLQASTFIPLAILLFKDGDPRLAVAQLLLFAITILVYV